jgi:hypothetical protein
MILCDNCSPRKQCTAEKNKTECRFYQPMTNEEYIKSCSTEQLVQVIHLMTTSCYVCGKDGVDYKRCYFRKKCTGPKEIEEWLKEPHDFYE